ncbi:MAG: hypothetical protein LUH15_20065 [Tannerellaceae bacterium]|nr:hypothetical protein [Tannerellaceae bacterium]
MEDVKMLLQNKNIKYYQINRSIDSVPNWEILHYDPIEFKFHHYITIHGVSGEILKDNIYP